MSPPALVVDVDDTDSFLKAARAHLLSQKSVAPLPDPSDFPSTESLLDSGNEITSEQSILNGWEAPSSQESTAAVVGSLVTGAIHAEPAVGSGKKTERVSNSFPDEELIESGQQTTDAVPDAPSIDDGKVHVPPLSASARVFTPLSAIVTETPESGVKKEHCTIFRHTWGAPESRTTPSSKVRRVILKGFPSSWATPSKVLGLIYGGKIDQIYISENGTAHVVFCDHAASQAYYEKHPNGMIIDSEKPQVVFVEQGSEVDVISSQLAFYLSIGATRVVRAIGVDLNISMEQLLKMVTANGRKLEKLLDSYSPGEARSVTFRFCSIDDAVRFRSVLLRDDDWEHCNIQYACDPCEVASSFHAD